MPKEAKEVQYSLGQVAPDFDLPDLNGGMISLNSLKGNSVVIHFATTWCPFCNAEAMYLYAMENDTSNSNTKLKNALKPLFDLIYIDKLRILYKSVDIW